MNVQRDFRNEMLKRKEIVIISRHESNPGFEKAERAVAEHFKVGTDAVAIKKVGSNFGSDEFVIEAFVYDSAEDKMRVEPKKKEKKQPGA